jgi:hypothetical protein
MTKNEFGEIREAWTELKNIYEEIDTLNTDEQTGPVVGAFAAQTATAQ